MLLFLGLSCKRTQPLSKLFAKQTPREKYEQTLGKANLLETSMGKKWVEAGENALKDSLTINLPFQEVGFFSVDKPQAISYRMIGRRGELLTVNISTIPDRLVLFLDLLEVQPGLPQQIKHIVSADTTDRGLTHEFDADGEYLLRLQPELLQGGKYTISITARGAMSFPVQSKESRHVGSFFGVDRDGGRRRHEGVDIFAAKHTPAVAATEGVITRVNENRLGGKVVWLRDSKRQQTLYYAHLDSQMVRPGQKVFPGDTIGLIGNTGNAKFTPPHLHFGIYTYGFGAIDPFPSINTDWGQLAPIVADQQAIGQWYRTKSTSNIRRAPSAKADILLQLPKSTPIYVQGASDNWYRAILPDGASGYVFANLVENATNSIRLQIMEHSTTLFTSPLLSAIPVDSIAAESQVEVLGAYGTFLWVKNERDHVGWIHQEI